MSQKRHFTDEQRGELLSNPYTARVTECSVTFTRAFKQLVIANIDKPGMTARKVFELAGYSDDLFSAGVRRYIVTNIRKENQSPGGLKESAPVRKQQPKKHHTETEVRKLQERVEILEQQINFLKKSLMLKRQDRLKKENSSS